MPVQVTQALEPCAGKSSWGRASNLQEDYPSLMERGEYRLIAR